VQYGPVTSDADGYFEIATPAGTYEVWAGARWYNSVTHYDVVVSDTETAAGGRATAQSAIAIQDFALARYAQPVYRFLNLRNGTYFYTATDDEMNNVVANLSHFYKYETVAYALVVDSTINNMPLYRFYNKHTGAHFYTMDEGEKAYLMSGHPGWHYEGVAYKVSASPTWTSETASYPTTPVYRYYNPGFNAHFYSVMENWGLAHSHKTPWHFEGVAFYIDPRWAD